jgi:hypothetical protein
MPVKARKRFRAFTGMTIPFPGLDAGIKAREIPQHFIAARNPNNNSYPAPDARPDKFFA